MKRLLSWMSALELFLTVSFAGSATADNAKAVADFYRGKTITIVVGSSSGGGYDLTARAVARVMSKYIPGEPRIVVQNKPGASSIAAANYVGEVLSQDGTAIAAVQRPMPFQFLFSTQKPRMDPATLQWLGSTAKEPGVFVAWHTAAHKTLDEIRSSAMVVGGNGPKTDTELYARAMKNLLGMKLKIVSGYPGQSQIVLAMERGEVEGTANWSWSDIESRHMDWIRDKKIRVLLQISATPIPALKGIPLFRDLAKTDEQRQIIDLLTEMKVLGRPFFLAPHVPSERVAALRTAFMKTMEDSGFLAEAARTLGRIDPVDGVEMQQMMTKTYRLPPSIIAKARKAVQTSGLD